jgi:zinc protease
LDAATKCGTEKFSAIAYRDTADKYGILSYGTSTLDYGYIEVNCISKYFDKAWDLFTAAVMTPAFEVNEVQLLKDKKIGNAKDAESNPENQLYKLQMRNEFGNSPYAIDPTGNEESISALNANDLKNYYRTLLNKNKIFIVIDGNIDKQEIYEKILLSFSAMPSSVYFPPDLSASAISNRKLFLEKRDLKIKFVGAIMNSPEYTNIDYVPFRMGISGLGGNVYYNLRTRLNLAYFAGATISQLRIPCTRMYAATNDVQAAMNEMYKLLKNMQTMGMQEEWLRHIKYTYLTTSYLNEQSASAITNNLGLAEILGGWQYAEHLTKLAEMTTAQQVTDALNSYIGTIKWTVVGNVDEMDLIKVPTY